MSSCSTDLTSSVPNFSDGHFEELRDAEAAARRALKNIQSLYDEIMTPKAYPEIEAELCYESGSDSPVPLSTGKSKCKVSKKYVNKFSNNSKSSPLHTVQKYSCINSKASQTHSKKHQTYSVSSDDCSVSNPCDNYLAPKEKIKVTVPKPFSLCNENIKRQQAKELKIAKIQEELNEQSEKEFKVRISSKPVPKHVNLPLYEEMVARNEKRKIERKEKSQEIVKNLKPFKLSYMKSSLTRSHSDGNISKQNSGSNFKAKPVPKCILDENLTKKLKNKEEIRKLLNAQRAEDMLKKSSSPITPKNIRNNYSTYYAGKSKNKPKFSQQEIDAVTKRLYTLKCKEALEDWNNKVLQNNLLPKKGTVPSETSKTVNQQENSHDHIESTLPFYSFPVRMSTASILRDKLIREEIIKRERREDTGHLMKIETEKKRKELIKNIWPRLKSVEQNTNLEENIIEKVKSYKESQKSRELEYLKELEEMMERVSKQNLLIERQSKGSKASLKEDISDSEEKLTSDKQVSDDESESSDQYTENAKSSDENSEKADSSSHPPED